MNNDYYYVIAIGDYELNAIALFNCSMAGFNRSDSKYTYLGC